MNALAEPDILEWLNMVWPLLRFVFWPALVGLIIVAGLTLLGVRYIPNNRVGIVECLWSREGSVSGGQIIALNGEAGYQADLLRGGICFRRWRWQYRIHKMPLIVVPQGKIGYVYARDGQALKPEQTLGRIVPCNDFQDARAFLTGSAETGCVGQRGRQRAILREGVYAINLALFVVITQDTVYRLDLGNRREGELLNDWHRQLLDCGGFDPVLIGSRMETSAEPVTDLPDEHKDTIGIVTVHDGPSLDPGQIISPAVGTRSGEAHYHNNYQDPEAFLRAGGRRGRQYIPLTDGTYFINRWFATVEMTPKTVVPIGSVGVVVSYYGREGHDVSGEAFRHGQRVGEGERGVWEHTLGPGKYPFNTYAGRIHLVPTTNFVLHWVTGKTETHKYDESLKSIDLVTADAYEPVLPLSVVVHIDYRKAPNVIQRFGDVKKLITQTLDPLLSAYFRDIAHKKTMLELLHDRDLIQKEAKHELETRFAAFDIELIDVLIGKPDTSQADGAIEQLLEQLRLRQLSKEQIVTYKQQSLAAEELKALKETQTLAEKQAELTASKVQIQIADNEGNSDLARARKRAEQTVVTAEAENRQRILLAESRARARFLLGEAQGKRVTMEGEAEADVIRQKIESYGNPKLYALALIAQHLSQSRQPLVPDRLFLANGNGNGQHPDGVEAQGLLGTLINLLVAERSGLDLASETTKPAAPAETDNTVVHTDRRAAS